MNFIYFGSFRLSADILELLIAGGFTPSAVICSPDRPAGRKQIVTAPAVKQFVTTYNEQLATDKKIKILQPEKAPDVIPELKKLGADFFVVMGYPQIISQDILDIPRLGTIGVHPSLLPKYRGASPIQTALLHDEVETGVTLYQMDAKMDHGRIIASNKLQIANEETNTGLEKKLAKAAADLLIETLPKFVTGEITPIEQDHTKATFTKKFTTADGQVDMKNDSPQTIYNKIRAFNPEPSVWTMNFPGYEGKRVKLLATQFVNGALKVTEILPEGKKPIRL
jgi:methionyl-tRNA formyltransferase